MKLGDIQWLVLGRDGEFLGIVKGVNRAAARAAAAKEYPDFEMVRPA